MAEATALGARFVGHLRGLGIGAEPLRLVVAVSGGRDSVTLLHLLCFAARELPFTLAVAHLDHGMRAGSAADAAWLRGLCAAWGVPLETARLSRAPRGETEARAARYAFLRRVARERAAPYVVTAHHADDQAETVLFRALRGTGIAGLAGMPAVSSAGVLRPLLPYWGSELEAYAGRVGLRWREDETNLSTDPARNRIRREILPLVERTFSPGARRRLVSLAGLAREAEGAIGQVVARALPEVAREEGGGVVLARAKLRDYDSAVATRILRHLLRRFGVVPSGAGTRRALQFITRAPSGREMQLAGGVRIRVEFETARLTREGATPADEPATIEAPVAGAAVERAVRVGGRGYRVTVRTGRWDGSESGPWRGSIPLDRATFPLTVRGWAAGDRIGTSGGTKTLKKLFLEGRVPRSERHRLPVVAGADGRVLWVGGMERALAPWPAPDEEALILTVVHD